MSWTKIKRDTEINFKKPMVTFRNEKVVKFNPTLVSIMKLEKGMYADCFINDSGDSLRFVFNDNKEGWKLSNDGGQKQKDTNGLIIQSVALYNNSKRLLEIAKSNINKIKNIDCNIIDNKTIEIIIAPCFELVGVPSSTEDIGIYKLYQDEKVVYIGKGKIKSRIDAHKKKGLLFNNTKYSILNSDDDCFYWESIHINSFVSSYGKLPIYNKIKGKKID